MTADTREVDRCATAIKGDFKALVDEAERAGRPEADVAAELQEIAERLEGTMSNFGSRLSLTDLENGMMLLAERGAHDGWPIGTVTAALKLLAREHADAAKTRPGQG